MTKELPCVPLTQIHLSVRAMGIARNT